MIGLNQALLAMAYGWRTNAPPDNSTIEERWAVGGGGLPTRILVRSSATLYITEADPPFVSPQELARHWAEAWGHLKALPGHSGGGYVLADEEIVRFAQYIATTHPTLFPALFAPAQIEHLLACLTLECQALTRAIRAIRRAGGDHVDH
jgi:hypothetical protein